MSTPTTPYIDLVVPFALSGLGMALFFAPVAISPLAIALLWQWIFDYQGALNRTLVGVGLGSWRRAWTGDPSTALWTILVVMVWQFSGLAMVAIALILTALITVMALTQLALLRRNEARL